jgi:DNA-directed RNA polymerase sigma subunit (sigma70/sigma32)
MNMQRFLAETFACEENVRQDVTIGELMPVFVTLPARMAEVLIARINGRKYKSIAADYGLSITRMQQHYWGALRYLRNPSRRALLKEICVPGYKAETHGQ